MAEKTKNNPKAEKPEKEKNWLTKALGSVFFIAKALFIGLIISICISIVIEWVGMTFWWADNPDRAKEMFFNEYNAIANETRAKILKYEPILVINYTVTFMYNALFESSFTTAMQNWFADPNSSGVGLIIKKIIVSTYNYIVASAYVALTLTLRATIFILSLPFYVLCGFIGVTGGLVEREIRKDQGGIEHAFLYHMIRSHRYFFLNFFWVLYLSFPYEVRAEWFVLGGGLLFGITIYSMMWAFKKYL